MLVTSTNIKNNFGKYIRLAAREDIIITKNGKRVCKLISFGEDDDQKSNTSTLEESGAAYDYTKEKMTYEEFLEFNKDAEERYEYIDGEIYLLSSPKTIHQSILMEMTGVFYNWFKGKKCTPMFAPYDIKLKKNKNNRNVVQPDLMVICDLEEKLGEDDYYMGVPVLAVEIISVSSKRKDYIKKLDLYMSCGICEYWIVDPSNKEVYIYLFKDKDIYVNKTYSFDSEIKSFYFKGLTLHLNDFL